jgi:DNA-binding LacI/PurR family transcriptional regulator
MQELGYEPNFQASNLASKNSKTIGIVLPTGDAEIYENAFYLETIRGIGQFCNQKQYMNTLVTGSTDNELLHVIKSMVKSGRTDGFIVLYSKKDDPVLEYLYEQGITYVLIGKPSLYPNQIIYIDNDNILAAKEATDYLIRLGHEHIAFLGIFYQLIFYRKRIMQYPIEHFTRAQECVRFAVSAYKIICLSINCIASYYSNVGWYHSHYTPNSFALTIYTVWF